MDKSVQKFLAYLDILEREVKDEALKAELIKNNTFLMKIIPQNNLRAIVQSSGGLMNMGLAKLLLAIANIISYFSRKNRQFWFF